MYGFLNQNQYFYIVWFYFFFFSYSGMQKFHHLLECHATSINSLFNSFLSALSFSNLICQAKSLTIFYRLRKKAVLITLKIKTVWLIKKLF